MKSQNFEELRVHYEKLSLTVNWGSQCDDEMLTAVEKRLSFVLQPQLKMFYQYCNGFGVQVPHVDIFKLENLKVHDGFLMFCKINNQELFGFNLVEGVVPEQRDIYHVNSGQLITYTFASFMFNKLEKWVVKNKQFWLEN